MRIIQLGVGYYVFSRESICSILRYGIHIESRFLPMQPSWRNRQASRHTHPILWWTT